MEVRSGTLIHDGVEDVATTIGGSGGSEICTVQKIGGMNSTKVKGRLTEEFHLSKAKLSLVGWLVALGVDVGVWRKGSLRPPTMKETRTTARTTWVAGQ